ncbi:acyl carrier protein [Thiorhodococcus mannitoliphagus]|uniref:Acyl carrier protein n=1 Tax=Thiorhodococcus mannitoliphagus TaxID=329406 RepID=A0A6P1E205_9GAMM|nr:acyl carrier protein [Thiorhodococcus mannitoliphagus]NEX22542.1 acyl carrier protein [Thiorhodococcus mannitoliphagus]
MPTLERIRTLLDKALGLGGRAERFDANTPLLGNLPELDSMAVVTLITTIEEQFGFIVDDDEINAETFATLGTLAAFVEMKLV